jgi:hypothetical protein
MADEAINSAAPAVEGAAKQAQIASTHRPRFVVVLGRFVLLCLAGWATLAVYFSDLSGAIAADGSGDSRGAGVGDADRVRTAAAAVGEDRVSDPVRRRAGVVPVVSGPRNDRAWLADVARTPYATFDAGDENIVTIHNVRNFEYRSETDFTERWEDRTYDCASSPKPITS